MTGPVENGWTKRIVELEKENRRLAERHSAEKVPPMRAIMDMAPIWDARTDLVRLGQLLGAALYLTGPDDGEDPAKNELITALTALYETISEVALSLDGAITGMKIIKEVAG